MRGLLRDLSYAARVLAKKPAFTAVVVLTLALGIGANATIFSLADAILLRAPSGIADPDRLIDVYTSDYSGPPFGASSYPDYEDFAANAGELSGLAAFEWQSFNVAIGGDAFRAFGEYVSDGYFRVLGVAPALGRTFADAGGTSDEAPAAVIGYALWQQRFGGAPDVIGRTLRIRAHDVTVVGVAPRGFSGTQSGIRVDLWVPRSIEALLDPSERGRTERRDSRGLFVIGRLAPGATFEAARARFDVVAARLHSQYPQEWTDVSGAPRRITALPHRQAVPLPELRGAAVSFVTVLAAVAALVLLICCANLANLLLTRAAGRAREVAVRTALGATRARIVRQLLAESVLLASLGGACGVLVSAAAGTVLARLEPPLPIPVALNLAPNPRVLAFSAVLSLVTGIVLGALPALRATRHGIVHGLRRDASTPSGGRRFFTIGNALVVGQVAVSSALLVVMGLFVQSLIRAEAVDLGFRPDGVALVTLDLESQGYAPERAAQFLDALETAVRRLPGVRSAAFARSAPLGLDYPRRGIRVEGYTPSPGEEMEIGFNAIDEDYFAALGIGVLRGRSFGAADRVGAPPVAIVSQAFVRKYWPDGNALGRHIDFGAGSAEVVGVAADAKYRSIRDEPAPYFYVPRRQVGAASGVLEVRTERDPAALL
ncbi:MAG TPA: ADOP family duplicated permease, partial [Gammaproteobacteria bacterium]|nr:ADOP family duplicated permease [Gammaproteobacteria bacterium]